jgi:hypothetical protein
VLAAANSSRGFQDSAGICAWASKVTANQRLAVDYSAVYTTTANTLCLGSSVIADVRNYHATRLMSAGVAATMRYLYPRMVAIHDLSVDVGFPSSKTGRLILPSPMPSSYTHMEPDGVYLIGELTPILSLKRTLAHTQSEQTMGRIYIYG